MQKSFELEKAITFANAAVYYPPTNKIHLRKKKREQGFWALKDVSFEINKGDILGIVGRNGAGKTTTLSLINGIIAPDRGSISTYQNTSSLLSINAGMVPELSGEKNIYLLGLILGIEIVKIKEKVAEIIEYSELGDFIYKPINTYSTGMKSRLGFATAIYLQPDILLIDEITGVGDRAFKKKSKKTIREKLQKNVTAVIVSHSESMIKELCTKALWIENGVSVAFGNPEDVVNEYVKATE